MAITKKDMDYIKGQLDRLTRKLIEKKPAHFKMRDIANAFLASLMFGFVFIFKGNLIAISLQLTNAHLVAIVIATLILLTLEIYFVGYTRVPIEERKKRTFGEFWLKRFVTLYAIAFVVSFGLIYLYNIDKFVGTTENIIKVVVSVSLPCAVAAAVPSLLKKY